MRDSYPFLDIENYKDIAPLIVVDVSHQNEMVKTGPIDVRVEFDVESSKPTPAQTTAYCLVLHDRTFEYLPLTGEVKEK